MPRTRLVARLEISQGRNIRERRRACCGRHRHRVQFTGPSIFDGSGYGVETYLHLTGEEISNRLHLITIRYVNDVDSRHHLEKFGGELNRTSVRCTEVQLSRICFGIGDELRDRL